MAYKIVETIESNTTEDEVTLIQIIETDTEHVVIDFENSRYTKVTRWRFESGFVRIDADTKIEITRLLMSCSSNHAHGVYYQAPRHLELWEAMFAIGESPAEVPTDLFKDGGADGTVPEHPAE